jgi:hypothetical protein
MTRHPGRPILGVISRSEFNLSKLPRQDRSGPESGGLPSLRRQPGCPAGPQSRPSKCTAPNRRSPWHCPPASARRRRCHHPALNSAPPGTVLETAICYPESRERPASHPHRPQSDAIFHFRPKPPPLRPPGLDPKSRFFNTLLHKASWPANCWP